MAEVRYRLRITEQPGQSAILHDAAGDLTAAIAEAEAYAADGYIGCRVEVIDISIGHPDRNVVHVVEGR